MKLGLKSVLFGAHCILLHPWFVWWSWCRLYGFTLDLQIILACILHDVGYVSKSEMDSEDGELHPYLGAKIMGWLFGTEWYDFTLYHSRHLAKKHGKPYSRLCVADKLAGAITPWWLYLPMVSLTGEIKEYMFNAWKNYERAIKEGKPVSNEIVHMGMAGAGAGLIWSDKIKWHKAFQSYMTKWVAEHKDGKEDTWTTARYAA